MTQINWIFKWKNVFYLGWRKSVFPLESSIYIKKWVPSWIFLTHQTRKFKRFLFFCSVKINTKKALDEKSLTQESDLNSKEGITFNWHFIFCLCIVEILWIYSYMYVDTSRCLKRALESWNRNSNSSFELPEVGAGIWILQENWELLSINLSLQPHVNFFKMREKRVIHILRG